MSGKLHRDKTTLVVVDVQEGFREQVRDHQRAPAAGRLGVTAEWKRFARQPLQVELRRSEPGTYAGAQLV